MGEPSRRQLEYVWSNRQRALRAEVIGTLARRGLDPRLEGMVEHREAVRECVGRVVDDTFREFCTLGKVDKRSVEIIVAQPSAAAALRQQWHFHLLDRLDHSCRFEVTPRIRFRVGGGGDVFGPGAPGGCGGRGGVRLEVGRARER